MTAKQREDLEIARSQGSVALLTFLRTYSFGHSPEFWERAYRRHMKGCAGLDLIDCVFPHVER